MGAVKKVSPPRPYPSLRHRILANVERVLPPSWTGLRSRCWAWKGGRNARGYAQMSFRRMVYGEDGRPLGKRPRQVLVHRLVLKEFFGIPLELVETAMHRCSTKLCINPEHIDPGTAAENRRYYYEVERAMLAGGGAVQPDREPGSDDEP